MHKKSRKSYVVVLSVALLVSMTVILPAASLVQYWPLEEMGSASATNAVASGNIALIRNQDPATAWMNTDIAPPLASRSTACAYLDGAAPSGMFQNYLDLGALGLSGSGSVSFWVNPADLAVSDIRLIVPTTETGAYQGLARIDTFGTGGLLLSGNNVPPTHAIASDYTTFLTAGNWTHVAFVFDRGRCTLYANGVAVGTNYSGFNYGTSRMALGARLPSPSNYATLNGNLFRGQIDDVSIWNGPISAATVAQLANGVSPLTLIDAPQTVPARLVQYYPLEEDAGAAVAANLAGNATGDLVNFNTANCWVKNSGDTTNTPPALTNSTTALAFDPANNYMDLGVLGLYGKGTVSMWINCATNRDVVNLYSQIDGGSHVQPGRVAIDSQGRLRTQTGFGSSPIWTILTPSNAVPQGTWIHFAAVYDNGYATFYVNGVRQNTGPALLGFSTSRFGVGNPLILGSPTTYGTNFWGMLDDISIWDGPLSPTSIQQLASGVCPTNIVDMPQSGPVLELALQTLPAPQLTQYWPLEGTPGSADAANAAGGNPGVLTSYTDLNSAWVTSPLAPNLAGRSTKALYLDGVNSYLSVGTISLGAATSPNGTISLWVSPSVLTGDRRLFGQVNTGSTIGFTGLTPAGQLWAYDAVSTYAGGFVFPGPEYGTLQVNQWVHLAFTYEGGLTTLYVNGVRQQSVPCGFTAVPLGFGNKTRTTLGGAFSGYMDDIAIWNRSLSTTSIAQLANGTSPSDIHEGIRHVAVLTWPASFSSGVVQRASNPVGPWTDVPVPPQIRPSTSPITASATRSVVVDINPSADAQYFRLKL
jgi:hypothetical protein